MRPREPLWPFSIALGLTSPPLGALWGTEKGRSKSIGSRAKGAQSYRWVVWDTAVGGLPADSKHVARALVPRGRRSLALPLAGA